VYARAPHIRLYLGHRSVRVARVTLVSWDNGSSIRSCCPTGGRSSRSTTPRSMSPSCPRQNTIQSNGKPRRRRRCWLQKMTSQRCWMDVMARRRTRYHLSTKFLSPPCFLLFPLCARTVVDERLVDRGPVRSDAGSRGLICSNATHDELAPALARKQISLLPFRAFFHSLLQRSSLPIRPSVPG
jgi:hypothetical protein